jgi:antitoxin (DNA-binding transcriptional repressor) of toxin-antitoxin stability system
MAKKSKQNTYSIYQARTQFSKLLKRVLAGEEIIIAHRDKAVAKLVTVQPAPEARKPGSAKNSFIMSDNFDAPLPDDLLVKFMS